MVAEDLSQEVAVKRVVITKVFNQSDGAPGVYSDVGRGVLVLVGKGEGVGPGVFVGVDVRVGLGLLVGLGIGHGPGVIMDVGGR